MKFQQILKEHEPSQNRKNESLEKLERVRKSFGESSIFDDQRDICVFAAGSLGRLDCGKNSDLDVFVTVIKDGGQEKISKLQEIQVFSEILKINKALKFPELSNDGQYLKIFDIKSKEMTIGSSEDDKENYFTTRMLLLLESNYLCNEAAYQRHKKEVISLYCRDAADNSNFKPVFLLNDLLRYWRTLCLNYEQARHFPSKSWKKRNFNLKYSRLLSVFGTVLPLIMLDKPNATGIEDICSKVPMERLAIGLDKLKNSEDLIDRFISVLDRYERFLSIKESFEFENIENKIKDELQENAEFISQFIFDALNRNDTPKDFRRFLVI